MVVRVKICGLTREEDVDAAVDAGADAVGFIVGFPKSPRNLGLEPATELVARVPPLVTSVLVTTTEVLRRDATVVKRLAPRGIQLYGQGIDPRDVRASLHCAVIMARSVNGEQVSTIRKAAEGYDGLLTDTFRSGFSGGTGSVSDWTICASIREGIEPLPMILSGGLRPENVDEAIRTVRPFAVDASSGLESSPGVKDPSKVKDFIRKATETA